MILPLVKNPWRGKKFPGLLYKFRGFQRCPTSSREYKPLSEPKQQDQRNAGQFLGRVMRKLYLNPTGGGALVSGFVDMPMMNIGRVGVRVTEPFLDMGMRMRLG